MSITITALIENSATEESLLAEHGLSLLIEKDGLTILFDAGPSADFLENAKHLGIDLSKVNYTVLSHAHFDHTSGLIPFHRSAGADYTLILNQNFFIPKYWFHQDEGYYEYVGVPFTEEVLMAQKVKTRLLIPPMAELEEGSGVYVMSGFSSLCDFEAIDATAVMRKNGCYTGDTFPEEQALAIPTEKGIVLITGCSHCGIVNLCETVKARLRSNIYAVIGGTHLIVADEERIAKTIGYFEREKISVAGVCHCTGEPGLDAFRQGCSQFTELKTGTVLTL